jgi:hypothetical protein
LPSRSPAQRPGPIEIRGSGTLTFRSIRETPAINRSSSTIVITGEPAEDFRARMTPTLDLATDEARAIL